MRSSVQVLAHALSTGAFDGRFNCSIHGATHTADCAECVAKIEQALADDEVIAATAVTGRACSWCGYMNEVSPKLSVYCAMCGHCAQVARVECICPRCTKGGEC
jgi:hypothetical protein